jgi:hypothetical protein
VPVSQLRIGRDADDLRRDIAALHVVTQQGAADRVRPKLRAAVSLTMTGRGLVWRRAFALSASVRCGREDCNVEREKWPSVTASNSAARACYLLSPERIAPPIIDSPAAFARQRRPLPRR